MAYIYKITNISNNKIYVGKTLQTIQERWQEHCKDALKENQQHRALYKAMNKYGFENFVIEIIEECLPEVINERETFWIENLRSFKNGYNMTQGGDGTHYLDYDLVIATYKQLQNCNETARKLNIQPDSVSKILKTTNNHVYSPQELAKINQSKMVDMFDLKDNYIRTFPATLEAARFLQDQNIAASGKYFGIAGHIIDVCKGKRKTAYGYKWKYTMLD